MNRRPIRETLTIWLVLFLTTWNGLRFFTALGWHNVLNEFEVRQSPVLTAIAGAVWLVVGLFLLWGLLWRKAWAGKMVLWAGAGYTVWYWIERLVWQEPRPNLPFAVLLNLVIFAFILYTERSITREMNERKN